MEPGIVVKKNKVLEVIYFLAESIPTLLVSAGLLGIGYWGASTEWTFKFPGSGESEGAFKANRIKKIRCKDGGKE